MEAYQLMQTYAVLAAGITQYFQYSEHNCDFICYWLVKFEPELVSPRLQLGWLSR